MSKKKCKYKGCNNVSIGEFCIQKGDVFPYCQKHRQNAANACIWDLIGVADLAAIELNKPEKRPKSRFKVTRQTPKMKK